MVGIESSGDSEPFRGMRWTISCKLALNIIEAAEVVIQVVAARSAGERVHEHFEVANEDQVLRSVMDIQGPDGGRLHIVQAQPGRFTLAYRAGIRSVLQPVSTITDAATGANAESAKSSMNYDRQVFLRPSRYCPSDRLVGFAAAEFGTGPDVGARVAAITDWIRYRINYVPGSSTVHDSAEDTLLTAVGICRDFAHLGIALCRATGVPARFVAVYAPGLLPMDFHAVFETFENGRWCVHDATGLAPRQSLIRVVTGRDAADTAFIAINDGLADLESIEVSAIVEPNLPSDDQRATVILA